MFGTCCVCLCVLNNENGLPIVLKNIQKMQRLFTIEIIVYYDKSHDKSLEILENYHRTHTNITIIKGVSKLYPGANERTKNLSTARNFLLQEIRKWYIPPEYFIMMDSNDYACVGDINIDVLETVLKYREGWDSVSFDREAGYYDYWALSIQPFIYSFFHMAPKSRDIDLCKKYLHNIIKIYKSMGENAFIPVHSAFNGFAIYKTSKFINCYYSDIIDWTLFPEGSVQTHMACVSKGLLRIFDRDCEHRHFHLQAIKQNGAKIYIYPYSLFKKVENPPPNTRGPC